MRTFYLVDNSAIQRIHRSPLVAQAMFSLLETGDLASCLPQLLEEGYSARNLGEWEKIFMASGRAKIFLPPNAEVARIAIAMQKALFVAGKGRAVGVSDLQIAATAVLASNERQRVIVIHYDADFDYLAQVYSDFHAQWIVPRGAVD